MNIHEYQAKEVLRKFGISTLAGQVALSPEEAVTAAKSIGEVTVDHGDTACRTPDASYRLPTARRWSD